MEDFKAGSLRKGTGYSWFLPEKINHEWSWNDQQLNTRLEEASYLIGELNAFARFVPNTDMFIKMHVLREAVVSSKIEGTRTEIGEALRREEEIMPSNRNDWREVNNYVSAMNFGIGELERLPLSNRLIRATHTELLKSGRGQHREAGEFRRSQNWIGGTTIRDAVFIPPEHTHVAELMSDLEQFLNNEDLVIPDIIRIAIAHYQFETIHPFLDGNGRLGRLLITLYLVSKKVLQKPLLYLSDFFERHRESYYDNLMKVRIKNDLLQWLKFFLSGIIDTCNLTISGLEKILNLKKELEQIMIVTMGKRTPNANKLLIQLYSTPVVNIKDVERILDLTPKAANDMVNEFLKLKILIEKTGYKRNRIFEFNDYLSLFK
ncbi:MAG TPA: Fic family protein [Cyclobacteriaceae bacterium]|nr:Fic family protein [Cyclobacteriaceae bacterium]